MYKVFIVDDEPFIIEGILAIIDWEQYGLEIVGQAINGEEALAALANMDVDIVITDIAMPKLNGLELIRHVKSRNEETKFIILSGYNEFDYIKEGMKLGIENFLLKPINVEELKQTIFNTVTKLQTEGHMDLAVKNMDIIRENILVRWVNQAIVPKELLERAKLLQINLGLPYYAVAVLRFKNKDGTTSAASELITQARILCRQMIENVPDSYCFGDLDNDTILILGQSDKTNSSRDDLISRMEQLRYRISDALHVDVFITLGSFESTFMEVSESYKNAKNMHEYYMNRPQDMIIDYDKMIAEVSDHPCKISINFENFAKAILARNKTEAFAVIEECFNNLQSAKGVSPSDVQNLAVEFILQLKKVGKVKEFDYKKIFSHVFQIRTLEQLKAHLLYSAETSIEYLASGEEFCPVIKRVLKYIEERYSEELSLKSLSQALNMNAIYLGQLFLQEMKVTFSDYVSKRRIDKAKELLLSTAMKANDIAVNVGYTDPTYFFRKFKKAVGVSPMEYRQLDNGI